MRARRFLFAACFFIPFRCCSFIPSFVHIFIIFGSPFIVFLTSFSPSFRLDARSAYVCANVVFGFLQHKNYYLRIALERERKKKHSYTYNVQTELRSQIFKCFTGLCCSLSVCVCVSFLLSPVPLGSFSSSSSLQLVEWVA